MNYCIWLLIFKRIKNWRHQVSTDRLSLCLNDCTIIGLQVLLVTQECDPQVPVPWELTGKPSLTLRETWIQAEDTKVTRCLFIFCHEHHIQGQRVNTFHLLSCLSLFQQRNNGSLFLHYRKTVFFTVRICLTPLVISHFFMLSPTSDMSNTDSFAELYQSSLLLCPIIHLLMQPPSHKCPCCCCCRCCWPLCSQLLSLNPFCIYLCLHTVPFSLSERAAKLKDVASH